MSWMIGWLSDALPPDAPDILSSGRANILCRLSAPSLCIVAGGIPQTFRSPPAAPPHGETESGWIVCGLGIRRGGDGCTFLSDTDWGSLLSPGKAPDLRALDGHFVVCRWAQGTLEAFSDQLGLRTLYAAQTPRGVFFSTRLDWIAGLPGDAAVDFRQLGPRWLSFNQYSYESCIRGVQRLGPGGYGVFTTGGVQLRATLWQPAPVDRGGVQEVLPRLRSLTQPALPGGGRISLGLSGGLDSRTLLAVLSTGKAPFDVHIFGSESDPDVGTAIRIANGEHLHASLFNDPVPEADECLRRMSEFAAQAALCEPATSALRLGYYGRIQAENKLMLDGGFGEFLRRQFLNRLLFRGRGALTTLDPAAVSRFLTVDRGRIFTPETLKTMEEGVTLQLREALESMPPISETGRGNFLDLFTIRYRVPNYAGPEQARLDGSALNYTPYVQPSLLDIAFSIPATERANGRIFKRLIRDLAPSLARYPLAKSGTTYPFGLGSVQSWLWTNVRSRIGRPYQDMTRHEVLARIREFVLDSIGSRDVRSYGAYDMEYVARSAQEYYRGNLRWARTLDWWLTFELWRRSLGGGRNRGFLTLPGDMHIL